MTLASLSIVIPTYNRQNYAIRAMRYWSRLPVKVYVWDGSANSLPAGTLLSLGENVRYYHRPVGFYQRLREAVVEIDTPFCMLAGDDEFYLRSGLERAIDALERDEALVACGGQTVGFWRQSQELRCCRMYSAQSGRSVDEEDGIARMHHHMSRYTVATIYAVARTSAWKQVMGILLEREFSAYALGELQFELAMAFLGKTCNLDTLFWMRSLENEGTRGTDISLDPARTFEGWWRNESSAGEVEELLEIMARGLASDKDERLELVAEIRRAFEAYLTWRHWYSCIPFHRRLICALYTRLKKVTGRSIDKPESLLLANAQDVLNFELDTQAARELRDLVSYIDDWYLNVEA